MKRQLAIDCGQKAFRYISYCHCASSVDLKGEIDVLQDCFYFYFFVPRRVVPVDLERSVDFPRVVALLHTDTSLQLTEEKKNSSKSAGLFLL